MCIFSRVERIQSREVRSTNAQVRREQPTSTVYHSGPTLKELWTPPKRRRRRVIYA